MSYGKWPRERLASLLANARIIACMPPYTGLTRSESKRANGLNYDIETDASCFAESTLRALVLGKGENANFGMGRRHVRLSAATQNRGQKDP